MLRRAVLGALLAVCLMGSTIAHAEAEWICEKWAPAGRSRCLVWIRIEVNTNGDTTASREGAGRASQPRTCTFDGREIPCQTALGSWSSYASSWCRRLPTQPGFDDPVWLGRTDGSIYACTRPNRDGIPDPGLVGYRWLPAPPEAPDPEDLALRLMAGIEFEASEMGMFPRGDTVQRMGYVGWNMWLWAAPTSQLQWGPVTESISEGGVTVTLTASVSQMVWEMGNGDTVTCGRGTEWSMARTRGGHNIASPDCGYMYEEDGHYTVTATSNWLVEWSGGGRSGTLPLSLQREAQIMVGELQSVNVGR